MKVRDVLKKLHDDGWILVKSSGGHRQYKHPVKPGKVTVPGHPSIDLPIKTLRSIYEQAGWEPKP